MSSVSPRAVLDDPRAARADQQQIPAVRVTPETPGKPRKQPREPIHVDVPLEGTADGLTNYLFFLGFKHTFNFYKS